MKDFEKITLTKQEYRLLKLSNKKTVIVNQLPINIALYNYGLINHVFSHNNLTNKYVISDSGRRYLIWYKKYLFKTYAPIIISCVALLFSLASIILSVIGFM